jgi:hypothetical protein
MFGVYSVLHIHQCIIDFEFEKRFFLRHLKKATNGGY